MKPKIPPFDRATVNEVLEQIVAEAPEDFRYKPPGYGYTCLYQHAGKPSCLVGQVAHRLGVPIPIEGSPDNKATVKNVSHFHEWFTADAIARLRSVQIMQDSGNTWAEAIA